MDDGRELRIAIHVKVARSAEFGSNANCVRCRVGTTNTREFVFDVFVAWRAAQTPYHVFASSNKILWP